MQQPTGRGYPAEVSANRLPVRNLSLPLQGSSLPSVWNEIAAPAPQIDHQKRRSDQRLRRNISESFSSGLPMSVAGRANASGLGCSRGSYRQHATKGVSWRLSRHPVLLGRLAHDLLCRRWPLKPGTCRRMTTPPNRRVRTRTLRGFPLSRLNTGLTLYRTGRCSRFPGSRAAPAPRNDGVR
jgi:hypothetical protein